MRGKIICRRVLQGPPAGSYGLGRIHCRGRAENSKFEIRNQPGWVDDIPNSEFRIPNYYDPFAGILLHTCSANAVMVSDGFTPRLAPIIEPSMM